VQPVLVDGHELCETAVGVSAPQRAAGTEVAAVGAAHPTVTAIVARIDEHSSPLREQSLRSGRSHATDHLVADDKRKPNRDGAGEDLKVGPTDSGGLDPDQGLALRLRIVFLADDDSTDFFNHYRPHQRLIPVRSAESRDRRRGEHATLTVHETEDEPRRVLSAPGNVTRETRLAETVSQ